MAESISRSMPALKALPVPVRIPTRVWLFSMASKADCNSESICGEMALRFSGRFSVSMASSPGNSSCRVSNMNRSFLHCWLTVLRTAAASVDLSFADLGKNRTLKNEGCGTHLSSIVTNSIELGRPKLTAKLLHHGRVRVFRANFVGHLQQRREGGGIDSGVASRFADGGEDVFGGDIADESVTGERAAAESGERGV